MPSTITHIFISAFILIIFCEQLKLSKRMIIILSPLSVFPDIDIFLFHRATLHNVFILIIPLLIYIFWKDIKVSGIIAFYLASHIILDLFNQGIYLFYPLYNKVIYPMIGLSYNNNILSPIFNIIIQERISDVGIEMPIISSENTATIILVVVMLIISTIKHKSINSKK